MQTDHFLLLLHIKSCPTVSFNSEVNAISELSDFTSGRMSLRLATFFTASFLLNKKPLMSQLYETSEYLFCILFSPEIQHGCHVVNRIMSLICCDRRKSCVQSHKESNMTAVFDKAVSQHIIIF